MKVLTELASFADGKYPERLRQPGKTEGWLAALRVLHVDNQGGVEAFAV